MTWAISLEFPDRRSWFVSGEPVHRDQQTFSFEGTFALRAHHVVVGRSNAKRDGWACRLPSKRRTIHLVGTSSEPLPSQYEWPRNYWDHLSITLTQDDQPIRIQLTDPSVEVIYQDGERFVLCIHGLQFHSVDDSPKYFAYAAVLCTACGGKNKPGIGVQGAKGDVFALCDDCRTKLGGGDTSGQDSV